MNWIRKRGETAQKAHALRPLFEQLECRQLLSGLLTSAQSDDATPPAALEITDAAPIATTLTLTAPTDRIDPVSRYLTLTAKVTNSLGENVRKPIDFLFRVPGCAERIPELPRRKVSELLSHPFRIPSRNVPADPT